MPGRAEVGGGWGLTHRAVPALVARGAGAGVGANVVLACPIVEAGLGDAWRATCGRRRGL